MMQSYVDEKAEHSAGSFVAHSESWNVFFFCLYISSLYI